MAGNIKLIGAVGIKVRPDTTGFKSELRGQIDNLPEYKLDITVDADLSKAKHGIDRARKEEEAKEITLKVGVDYDSINKARQQVKDQLGKLNKTTADIPVKLNESDLLKAQRKLERLARGARVDVEINEDRAGYQAVLDKIRKIQRENATVSVNFKTDKASLAKEARKYEKLIAETAPKQTITITHHNDHESLTAAIKQIDDALRNLKAAKITTELDEAQLLKEKAKLENKLKTKPLTIKINDDKAGYEKALAKITELQRQAAEIPFTFKTDEQGLIKAAIIAKKKIEALTPKPKVTFSYDNDTHGLKAAIAEVDNKLKALRQIKLTANLDEKGLTEAKAKLEALHKNSSFDIKFDKKNLAELEAESKKLQGMLGDLNPKTVINVKNDKTSLEHAKRELDDLVKQRKAELKAEPITLLAAAQLAYASRARTVPFYVKVNERSLAIAEGVLKSLAGINFLQSSGRFVEGLLTKFDEVILKAGAIGTAIGSIADSFVYVGTTAFTVADGMLQSIGLLAAAPATLSALAAGLFIYISAFDNFGDAFSSNATKQAAAMEKLPPAARKAADSMRGLLNELQRPVQENFWSKMGTSLQDSIKNVYPVLKDGLARSAAGVGDFTAGMLRSFNKIALSGDLKHMFDGLDGFFKNLSKASEPFFDAFNKFGLKGSELLPKFGQWLADLSIRFDNFATKSAKNGDITRWIDQGVVSLQNMWSLGGGIIKMFGSITTAALRAGTSGLGDVARRFNEIGDMMKGEPFQSRLSRIFDGARTGASKLNVGLQELGTTLGESAVYAGNLLTIFGDMGGKALSGVAKVLGNTTFQTGTLAGLRGLSDMMDTVQTGFKDLGTIIGNLSTIAGGAFQSIGPVINTAIGLLDTLIGKLQPALTDAIPGLMGLVDGLLTALQGPVALVGDALSAILTFINGLPGPLSAVGLSMIAFLLLAGKIGPIFAAKPGGFLERIKYDFQQAEGAGGKFKVSLKGLGAGLLGAVGGPWGIAIGLVTTGLGLMGEAATRAKADVDAHTAALDANTGAFTRNNAAVVASAIMKTDGQPGVKSASETIKALGMSVEETSKIVAQGGKPYDDLMQKLRDGAGAAELMSNRVDDMGLPIAGNADAWNAWTDKVGIASDAAGINGTALSGLIGVLDRQRGAADSSRNSWLTMNDALDVGNQRVLDFNTAMQTYNDTTQTADTRTRGLKDALDLLNGKQPNVEEAQLKVNDAMRAAAGTAQTLDGKIVTVGGAFHDANGKVANFATIIDKNTGLINTASDAGSNLYKSLQGVTTNVLGTATAMKDAGKPVADISAFLKTNRDDFIAQGVQAGLSADLVGRAYDHMIGANPKDLITTITAQGVEEAQTKIKNYKGTLDEIDAYKAVASIGGDNVVLGVTLADSYTKLSEWDKAVGTATAGLDKSHADAVRLQMLTELVNLAATNPTVLANMDPALLERARSQVEKEITDLGNMKPTPEVKAETADAKAQLDIINGLLDKVTDRHANISVNTVYTESGPKPAGYQARNGVPTWNANGGLYKGNVRFFADGGFAPPQVKRFANGGINESHVAQIARSAPGQVRVWAEEETQGEAYIPLSSAKRARSTQILSQVAREFGYSLTRVNQYADGGVVGGGGRERGGQVSVNIDSYIQQSNNTADDVARSIMRRVRSRGVYSPLEGF